MQNEFVNSPEFLHGELRQIQSDSAADIHLRTMARIGELHLNQSSDLPHSEHDTEDSEGLEQDNRHPFYTGF